MYLRGSALHRHTHTHAFLSGLDQRLLAQPNPFSHLDFSPAALFPLWVLQQPFGNTFRQGPSAPLPQGTTPRQKTTAISLSKPNSCIGPTGTTPPHSNLYLLRSCTTLIWNQYRTKGFYLFVCFLQVMLRIKISTWSLYWAILIKGVLSLTDLLSWFVLSLNHSSLICEQCNMLDCISSWVRR